MSEKVICKKVDFTPEQVGYYGSRLEVLNDLFLKQIKEKKLQSAGYCLSKDGKIFANNAMGKLTFMKNDTTPFTPESLYGVYSITKVVTAVAILKLVEDGKIRLDQSVGEIIEEFNTPPFKQITIVHLLTHTSGIYHDDGAKEDKYHSSFWDVVKNEKSWIKNVLKKGLGNAPGKEWAYSTLGYMILGEIITRVSEIHCYDYIMKEIIIPCDMRDTDWYYLAENKDRYNVKFEWTNKRIANACLVSEKDKPRDKVPHTGNGLISTSEDIMKFGIMLLNNGKYQGKHILGRKAVEAMRREHTAKDMVDFCWGAQGTYRGYGLGPDIIQENNRSQFITPGIVCHEGWGTCCLMIDYKEKFVAVWSAQFCGTEWLSEPLRNAASIMWSGIM